MSINTEEKNDEALALRILVIDDELVIGKSCQRILGAEGHEVEYFRTRKRGCRRPYRATGMSCWST